jgi:putative DNA primase/helicase
MPLGREPGRKSPPPFAFTGHGKPYPSGPDIAAWLDGPEADRNIGVRMPPGVIGLDIDAGYTKVEHGKQVVKRGEDTLNELEAKYGPLPPTWVSSARPAPSGIRFYRVPEQLDGREINWPGEAGKFIEIIQPGHRYAVVWPSTNPDAGGAPYVWRPPLPAGVSGDLISDRIPEPHELARLPEAWVRGLALSYDRAEKADVADRVLAGWWGGLRDGAPCPTIATVTTRAIRTISEIDGSRHETARDALAALVRAGGNGHRAVPQAVGALHEAFRAAVGDKRAGGEWQRLLAGAIRLAVAEHPSGPRQSCEHDPVASAITGEQLAAMVFTVPEPVSIPVPLPATARPLLAPDASRDLVDELIRSIDDLPAEQRDDAVRVAAGAMVAAGATEGDIQRARAALTTRGGASSVALGEWDAIVREAKRAAKEVAKATAAARVHAAARAEVAARRDEGRLLPPPHAPIEVARDLAESLPAAAKWWRGDFYLWDGTRYRLWRDEAVDNWLYARTADAMFDAGEEKGPVKWRPDEVKIGKVAHALSRGILYRPSELDPDDSPSQVACANGVYDVTTGALLPHTADRFNLASVPFDYDPSATAPTWEWFLSDVLPPDAQGLLQEWFGYAISGRTDLEKILHMQGQPRSGKGTAATVLEALLGADAVASPSMPSLVGTFGEQPLIGKTLAIFSDINWQFRDIAEAVEILKKISGRDTRDVQRKNREVWHGKLGVRFMIMGNDLPKFTDASGALAHRMLHVQFPGTVMGRERPSLKDDLMAELPGILNWALAGLARLAANGSFSVPRSSEELAAEVRRQQGPLSAFIEDTCARVDPKTCEPAELGALHSVYLAWAKQADVTRTLDRERFSAALTSAGLRVERKMVAGVRSRRVLGVVAAPAPDGFPAHANAWTALLNPSLAIPEASPVTPPEGWSHVPTS